MKKQAADDVLVEFIAIFEAANKGGRLGPDTGSR